MSARLNAAAAPAEHVGDTTGELSSLRLALEDADILAGEACSMITALARAARRHLSSPTTTSVDETVQLLNLIDEKSNYLRDSIDGLASELRPRLHAAAIPDRAAPTDAGRPAAAFVDADEFDQHVEALKEIRALAEAGTAFVSHYYAESAEHKESGYLFAALAARAMAAGEELDKTVAHLVQLAGQKRGGVQ